MVSANCGYSGGGAQAQKLLVHYGPVLWVDVGFDPKYRESQNTPPSPGKSRIEALVDTGAQESCIDSSLAAQLKLPVVDRRRVCGVSGSMEVDVHMAQVHIPALRFTLYGQFAGVHLIASGLRVQVLVGRTFLRHFRMDYDGTTGDRHNRGAINRHT